MAHVGDLLAGIPGPHQIVVVRGQPPNGEVVSFYVDAQGNATQMDAHDTGLLLSSALREVRTQPVPMSLR
jgi:hypothetical protein